MKISIATLFPDLYTPFLQTSIIQRAQEKEVISCSLVNMFSLVSAKERIDSPLFGPGAGMAIKPTVIDKAIEVMEARGPAHKVFFSPRGKKLNQDELRNLYQKIEKKGGHLALFPARYEGMDARVEEYYADDIFSIGDYVLMGGDLPAMVLIEGLVRLIPGVVGKSESVDKDSFTNAFVDFPVYTAPLEWKGMVVPEVVRSGNHQAIEAWRKQRSVEDTVYNHFEWLRSHALESAEDREQVARTMPGHYAVLMHDEIMLPGNIPGTTSVTSLDIHDIARSATTYGVRHYYLVTPLEDQQKIVHKMLDFWTKGTGVSYNPSRHRAVSQVSCEARLDDVIADIEKKEGKKPLLIATSAQENMQRDKCITYFDQKKVWEQKRPVLLIFGTGQGLGQTILNRVDYILLPLQGYSDFNHLSVRSAAAVIFDRWLGIHLKTVL